jgi:hypothetical protein
LEGGQISSTGNAPVTVTGTGGNGTSGNHGVLLETNSSISSGGGFVRLNGTRGAGSSFGLTTNGTNTLGQTGQSGNIALSTDSWGTAPTNIRTTGQVILAPLSTTATVGLNGGAGSVAIPNSWIAAINGSTPSRLVLGNPAGSGTGVVSIGGGWNLTSAAAVGALVAGSAVPLEVHGGSITVGGITAGSKPLLLRANTGNLTLDSGTILSSDASGDAITLAAAGNFINNAGSTALSTPNGRWLVYSSNPANDTIGSLANGFRRFSCTYMGACPAIPGSGNGLLYATTPTLSVTPSAWAGALTYGDAAPDLVGYAYDVSGYLGSDASTDVLSGSLSGSTSYRRGSNVGTYGVNHSGGALTSSMGYGFVYLQNASAITVGRANLTLSGTRTYDGSTIAHGSTLTALGVNGESFGLTGAGTVASRNAGTTVLSALGTLGLGPGANGALATNYNALSTSASSYAIDRAAVTLVGGFGAEHKPYDGTTNATLTGLAGLGVAGVLGGDAVSLSTASAAGRFDSALAGVGRRVSLVPGSVGLSGAAAGNYVISYAGAPTATADIVATAKTDTVPTATAGTVLGVQVAAAIAEWTGSSNPTPARRTVMNLCAVGAGTSGFGLGCAVEWLPKWAVPLPGRQAPEQAATQQN